MDNKPKDTIQDKNGDALLGLLKQDVLPREGIKFGKRYSQVIILGTVMFTTFIIRTILSVSIVAMTDPTASVNKDIPTYNWTDKSLIMASFLWGYCIPQIGAGYAADVYGGKWLLVGSTTLTAIAGLAIPSAAAIFGSKGVMVSRFLQGLSQGFVYPSINGVLGKWIPSNERSRMGTFVFSGAPLGIVVSMLATGYISTSNYGWPMAFYLFSTFGLVISGIYAYFGSSDPDSHPSISEQEKTFIQTNLSSRKRSELNIPWKEMLTCRAFLALIVTNISFNFTHWMLISETAIYLNKVMNFDLQSNSILTSLPYAVEIIVGIVVCFIADFLSNRKILSNGTIRKIMNNIGLMIPAMSLFFLGRTGPDDSELVIILIVLISCSQGTGKSGHLVNHMDLAPNFSGVMMGISNGISIVFSVFAPTLAQVIVTNEKNVAQWRIIFYITMGMNITSAIINTLFTSGKRQDWNKGKLKGNGIDMEKMSLS